MQLLLVVVIAALAIVGIAVCAHYLLVIARPAAAQCGSGGGAEEGSRGGAQEAL